MIEGTAGKSETIASNGRKAAITTVNPCGTPACRTVLLAESVIGSPRQDLETGTSILIHIDVNAVRLRDGSRSISEHRMSILRRCRKGLDDVPMLDDLSI